MLRSFLDFVVIAVSVASHFPAWLANPEMAGWASIEKSMYIRFTQNQLHIVYT